MRKRQRRVVYSHRLETIRETLTEALPAEVVHGPFTFRLHVDDGMAVQLDDGGPFVKAIYKAFESDIVEVFAREEVSPSAFKELAEQRVSEAAEHYRRIHQVIADYEG